MRQLVSFSLVVISTFICHDVDFCNLSSEAWEDLVHVDIQIPHAPYLTNCTVWVMFKFIFCFLHELRDSSYFQLINVLLPFISMTCFLSISFSLLNFLRIKQLDQERLCSIHLLLSNCSHDAQYINL